jgi:hypothetical protein
VNIKQELILADIVVVVATLILVVFMIWLDLVLMRP